MTLDSRVCRWNRCNSNLWGKLWDSSLSLAFFKKNIHQHSWIVQQTKQRGQRWKWWPYAISFSNKLSPFADKDGYISWTNYFLLTGSIFLRNHVKKNYLAMHSCASKIKIPSCHTTWNNHTMKDHIQTQTQNNVTHICCRVMYRCLKYRKSTVYTISCINSTRFEAFYFLSEY